MLSYLETMERLTDLRDTIRARLSDEMRDRQSTAEYAEGMLTHILGELVTPDPQMCELCALVGKQTPAVGTDDDGDGVCQPHILPTLLAGRGVRTSLDVAQNLAHPSTD